MAPKCVRLLLLLSFVTGPEVMSAVWRPSCPAGWFYYSSHCYGYFRKMGSWSQAEEECQKYGSDSHLATVSNLKEARVIAKYILGYQRNLPVWIGLHDPQKKQSWQWIDGSLDQYIPWNYRTKSEARHCAALNPKDRRWPRHAVYEPPVACTHSAVFAKASEGHFFFNINGRGHEVTDYDKDIRGFLSWNKNGCSERQHFLCKYRP